MRLRDRLIDGEGTFGVLARAGETFVHRDAAIVDVERVRVGEAGVRERVPRIGGDRLFEEIDRLGDTFVRALVPSVTPAQIQTVGRDALRISLVSRRRRVA